MRVDKKTEEKTTPAPVQPTIVKVKKEFRIPGTNLIAEEGDELEIYPPDAEINEHDDGDADDFVPAVDPALATSVGEPYGLSPEETLAALESASKAKKAPRTK